MADPANSKTKTDPAASGVGVSQPETAQAIEPRLGEVLTDAERATRDLKAKHEAIRSICPKGLEAEAEQAILEDLNIEDARKRFLELRADKQKPVGHQEPAQPEGSGRADRAEDNAAQERAVEGDAKKKEIDEDVLLRSLIA